MRLAHCTVRPQLAVQPPTAVGRAPYFRSTRQRASKRFCIPFRAARPTGPCQRLACGTFLAGCTARPILAALSAPDRADTARCLPTPHSNCSGRPDGRLRDEAIPPPKPSPLAGEGREKALDCFASLAMTNVSACCLSAAPGRRADRDRDSGH